MCGLQLDVGQTPHSSKLVVKAVGASAGVIRRLDYFERLLVNPICPGLLASLHRARLRPLIVFILAM